MDGPISEGDWHPVARFFIYLAGMAHSPFLETLLFRLLLIRLMLNTMPTPHPGFEGVIVSGYESRDSALVHISSA